MNDTDLCYTPATELAAMIAARDVSPVEATRAVLRRIERLQPSLNAFITVAGEQALRDARAAEQAVMDGATLGPLHGVPFSVKDLCNTARSDEHTSELQ